jgi:hypothetical protein
MIVFILVVFMLYSTSNKTYSPDSWGYVDIARSFFSSDREIGEILGTRDYSNLPWKNDSFPMLWPLVISPFLQFFREPALPIGAYLFVPIWLATTFVFGRILRGFEVSARWIAFGGMVLLAIPGYLDEGAAGRSIPLNLLLLTMAVWIILRNNGSGSHKEMIFVGVLLGLCASNRFDSLFLGPIVIICALAAKLVSRLSAVIGLVFWSIFPIIWNLYSWFNFGKLFISDNTRVATATESKMITYWELSHIGAAFNFSEYLNRLADNFWLVIKVFLISYKSWGIAIVFALVISFLVLRFKTFKSQIIKDRENSDSQRNLADRKVYFLGFSLIAVGLSQLMALIVTGYPDVRYWISTIALLLLFVLAYYKCLQGRQLNFMPFSSLALKLTAFLIASAGVLSTVEQYKAPFDSTIYDKRVIDCLERIEGVAILTGMEAFRIPATSDLRAATIPGNWKLLSTEDWLQMQKQYGVTAWFDLSRNNEFEIPINARGVLKNVECREFSNQFDQ